MSQSIFRAAILLGFTLLLTYLHLSGEMSKYINIKYSTFSQIAAIILLILFFVQLQDILQQRKNKTKHVHSCGHDHCDHDHGFDKKWTLRNVVSYSIILLPILSGFFLPAATLDSAMAAQKGILLTGNSGNGDKENPYQEIESEMLSRGAIEMEHSRFAAYSNAIMYAPEKFVGKDIEIDGFVFKEEGKLQSDEIMIGRFIITHCVADAGVIGFKGKTPEAEKIPMDLFVSIKGELDVEMQDGIVKPVIIIHSWEEAKGVVDPYVYP